MSETAQVKGPMQEIGVSGLRVFSGYVNEEFLRELQGARGVKVFAEMRDNDATIGALLFAIDLMCRRVKWRVEATADTPEAEEQAEFLESCLHDMSAPFEDVVSEALSMLVFGWSWAEIVYKRRVGPDEADPAKRSKHSDGRIGLRKLAPRAQETLLRWDMQEDGGIAGMIQLPPNGGGAIYLPIERGLLFRTQSRKNNPEGRSVLRNAYRSWFILKTIENVEAIGIERELAGLPVVRIPAKYLTSTDEADVAVKAAYERIAKQLKFNEQGGLVIPSDMWTDVEGSPTSNPKVSVELLSTGGQRTIDPDKAIRRHQGNIARTVLADFLMLGQGDKGSFALSSNKTDLFLDACQTFLEIIASVLNLHMVPRLWKLNGWPATDLPRIKPASVRPPDLAGLGAYLQSLSNAGATLFPDEELDEHVRALANLPAPKEEDLQARRDAADAAREAAAEAARAGGGGDAGGDEGGAGGAQEGEDDEGDDGEDE